MTRLLGPVLALLLLAAPASGANSGYEDRVVDQINAHRHRVHHVHRVKPGRCVDRIAERWAAHLASTGRFYHRDQRVLLDRCHAVAAGEILAKGDITPAQARRLWVASPAHHRVLSRARYRRIGVGAVHTKDGWVVVVNFIRH